MSSLRSDLTPLRLVWLGLAIAGAVLAGFQAHWGSATANDTLWAFRASFIVMGLLTLAATVLFMQLPEKEQSAGQASGPESHN